MERSEVGILRAVSSIAAFLSITIYVRVRSIWLVALLPFKIMALALSPLIMLVGLGSVFFGLLRRDKYSTISGGLAAVLAGWYIQRVTAPHQEFERAFGKDWHQRISSESMRRMFPRRYQFRTPHARDVPMLVDTVIGTHVETGDPLLADLWVPPNVPYSGLGVIYLHGSGWHYLSKDFYTRPLFSQLAAQGHVIIDVAYTMAPHATLKPMIADVYRAIAWMKANADILGIRADRIILAGASAGAHLALLAAYAGDHPDLKPADVAGDTSVRAVISYYGPGDLSLEHEQLFTRYGHVGHHKTPLDRALMSIGGWVGAQLHTMPDSSMVYGPGYMLPNVFGGVPTDVPDAYTLGSPLTHIKPGVPPTLLIHGAHDFAVDLSHAHALRDALRRADVPVVYVELPFTDHMFDLFFSPYAPAFQAATYDVERFLALMQ